MGLVAMRTRRKKLILSWSHRQTQKRSQKIVNLLEYLEGNLYWWTQLVRWWILNSRSGQMSSWKSLSVREM